MNISPKTLRGAHKLCIRQANKYSNFFCIIEVVHKLHSVKLFVIFFMEFYVNFLIGFIRDWGHSILKSNSRRSPLIQMHIYRQFLPARQVCINSDCNHGFYFILCLFLPKTFPDFKVHIFWEGHKILQNLPLTFDYSTYSQK